MPQDLSINVLFAKENTEEVFGCGLEQGAGHKNDVAKNVQNNTNLSDAELQAVLKDVFNDIDHKEFLDAQGIQMTSVATKNDATGETHFSVKKVADLVSAKATQEKLEAKKKEI